MTKVLFLTNNEISHSLANWLKKQGEEVVIFSKKINNNTVDNINPDIIISYNYKHIIKKDVIKLLPNRIINLHISFLPWNKGAHPNLWSFIEDTPKGVTIHLIDEGLDTGDILLQKEVFIDENKHTLKSSYELLHQEIQELFKENWESIKHNRIEPFPQKGKGSIHYIKDFEKIKHILYPEGWDIPIKVLKERIKNNSLSL